MKRNYTAKFYYPYTRMDAKLIEIFFISMSACKIISLLPPVLIHFEVEAKVFSIHVLPIRNCAFFL